MYGKLYCYIDKYVYPRPGLTLLNCQVPKSAETDLLKLKDILGIEEEVTDKKEYSAYQLSLRRAQTKDAGGHGSK